MNTYIGTKLVNAKSMNRQEYNDFRGWELPSDENGADEGYLVEYVDGGQANTNIYKGYVSWSPKDVFERAYRETGGMSFGEALECLKAGLKVQRKGWNGKGMWLLLVEGTPSTQFIEGSAYSRAGLDGGEILSHIDMYTVNSEGRRAMLPGWLASQTDMLSEDWCVVN